MSMLTKLKYVGVCRQDLLEVYVLFIRSLTEYCSVVWHSSLTEELTNSLERVQKTCLKVILGDQYLGYQSALKMCNLKSLHDRREDRCLNFAVRCLKHPLNNRLFPLDTNKHSLHAKSKEKFTVNFAKVGALNRYTIPYLQRMLNKVYGN